jgi:hypothetical protein
MSKQGAKRFLLILFVIYFGAVLFRVDFFPLSWVPMYGEYTEKEHTRVVIGDRDTRTREGFVAQRANGEIINLTHRDLNIPPPNFRRLYQQRAFNRGPPQHRRERLELTTFNQWWYETLVGPDPLLAHNYALDLLASINDTFGYGPEDPARIVRLTAPQRVATFAPQDLATGNIGHPRVSTSTAVITPGGYERVFDNPAAAEEMSHVEFVE